MVEKTLYDEDVKALKDWYSKQPHLPQDIEEKYFYTFISGTKSMEIAKTKIDAYFTNRQKLFKLFADVAPGTKAFQEHCQAVYAGFLPETTPEGYIVLFLCANKDEVEKYNVGCQLLLIIVLMELALYKQPTATSFIIVDDIKPGSGRMLITCNFRQLAAFITFFLKCCPVKMKQAYGINCPSFLDHLITFIKSMLPNKLAKRLTVTQDDSKLKETIPLSILPAEYGGKGKSLKELNDYWKKELDLHANVLERRMTFVVDEEKRPKDSCHTESLDFGVDGSFKSLTID